MNMSQLLLPIDLKGNNNGNGKKTMQSKHNKVNCFNYNQITFAKCLSKCDLKQSNYVCNLGLSRLIHQWNSIAITPILLQIIGKCGLTS